MSSANADKVVTSLAAAEVFARRLLAWCARNGIHGPIDWPRLLALSHEFADAEDRTPVSKMALAKALSRLHIPKSHREIRPDERGIVSSKRSDAKRKRVTFRILPGGEPRQTTPADNQLDLFHHGATKP